MKTLLIVWYSRTGGAEQMARAAARGARTEPEVRVVMRRADRARTADVVHADGLIFAAPENLAALAGAMKEFFDRSYYALLERVNGKPYAALICAGSDGSGALRQLERIATGLRLRAIGAALIANTAAQTPEAILAPKVLPREILARCEALGAQLAAGLAAGIY
ncbi:MAG: flavodoxin family protein [Nevskia sp.]|nr:flavodoxin family protein [Nevskia sp.]